MAVVLFSTFTTWSWLFALILGIAYVLIKWVRTRKLIDLIPGPPQLPVIGNLYDIMCSPEVLFQNLRKFNEQYYPIYKLWSAHVPCVNLLCPEDIEILISSLKHMEKSKIYECLQRWLGTGLLTSTGSKWHSRRKMLTPAFHFNILQEFMCVFSEQTQVLVEQLKEECGKDSTDIVPLITEFTLHSICETAMGMQIQTMGEQETKYKSAIYSMGQVIVYRIVRPWLYYDISYILTKKFREERKIINVLHSFTNKVIREREANFHQPISKENNYSSRKRLAMLDLLIAAKNSGFMIDKDGIREEVDTFMFEGHDTTSMSICFTLMLLARHQEIQRRVFQEISDIVGRSSPTYQDLQDLGYLERVIKESLRLYPSVPFISRVTSEEMRTSTGYVIPEGVYVNVHIYDLHRNPVIYPQPDTFDPDRFLPENCQKRHPFAYIPFSAGPRNCIGQKFAFLEMKIAIVGILQNFRLLPVDGPADLTMITDMIIRTNHGIRIKVCARGEKCS